jgi:E3 ubiquitin-protein ligase HUWE1
LIPNGRNIAVTDQNKIDYIRLISHHSMTSAIRSQIMNFLDGFYSVVPVELISLFSPTELELLISGLPEIDLEDLRTNTDYHQYRASDRIIDWFWSVLRGFTREEKALFVQFVTGTSKVLHDFMVTDNILI